MEPEEAQLYSIEVPKILSGIVMHCDNRSPLEFKNFDISNDPAYLTYHYVRDDGVSHECSSPADLFIQYDDNAFACLSTTGPDYINDIIAMLRKWDNPQAKENIRILEMGFTL